MNDPFGPEARENDFVSFSFVNDAGYDRVMATVHGSAEYVAGLFAIEDFDGKVSTLMKRATEVDGYFKGLRQGGSPKGS